MRNKFIFFLISIALLSGAFFSYYNFGKPISSDQRLYDSVALDFLGTGNLRWEGEPIYFEPFYPLFLAGVYAIFGHNYDTVRVIQIIIFALTALIVYFLTSRLFNKRIAIFSALLTALFYPLASAAGKLEREVLFAFLLILLAYLLYQSFLTKEKKYFVIAGVILGMATLTNAITQFLFLLIVANFLFLFRKELLSKEIILRCGIFLLFFFLTLSPWLLRNYFQYSAVTLSPRGGKILISRAETMEKVYQNYWGHLLGHTLGYYFTEKLYPEINIREFIAPPRSEEELKEIQEIYSKGYNRQEIDEIFLQKSSARILYQPHKYLLMTILDFVGFNNPIIPRPPTLNYSDTMMTFAEGRYPQLPDWVKSSILLSIRLVWLVFFAFIIYALVKRIRNWPQLSWIFLMIVYFNLTYSLVHGIARYALPIYPFYIILFTVGFSAFLGKFLQKLNEPR